MASGDKIYIADKETLDSVKSTVEKTNESMDSFKSALGEPSDPTSARPIFSYLESIVNSILLSKNYTSPAKIHHEVKQTSGTTGRETVIFSYEGSGTLYSVLTSNVNTSERSHLRIYVDDELILNMSRDYTVGSANGYCLGVLVRDKLQNYLISGNKILIERSGAFTDSPQVAGYIYSPIPIRVNKNVKIAIMYDTVAANLAMTEYTFIAD